MGFLQRFRHDEPQEQTCPRCRMPAPADAERCPECDWDLHEAYHAPEPAPERGPGLSGGEGRDHRFGFVDEPLPGDSD